MEPDPDSLPTPRDPTGPCPRCGRISNYAVEDGTVLRRLPRNTGHEYASFLRCFGCDEWSVVVTERNLQGVELRALHWYPAPGAGSLDPDVNEDVASCYDEGMRCLGIGANRAAAVMFRSALHAFVKDKGTDQAKAERHLKTALKHMKDDGSLHPTLWDWADHLNQLGNEGAHPEDYDDVTADEAVDLGSFVRHLIKNEYEMPAQLQRARSQTPTDETDG